MRSSNNGYRFDTESRFAFFRDAVRKTEESPHCTKACISLYNEGNGE